jgi:cbb3-type cytochrome oxidase subunit 3
MITSVVLMSLFAVPAMADEKSKENNKDPNRSSALLQQGFEQNAAGVFSTTPFQFKGQQGSLMIGSLVFFALSFIGVIFFLLTAYGGIRWFLAAGNKNEVEKAQSIFMNAAIGLIIVLSSYIMTKFITDRIEGITLSEEE